MKKSSLIIALLLVTMIVLTSCVSPSAAADSAQNVPEVTDTVVPSVVPSPTAEATESVLQQADETVTLQDNAWQWVSFTNPVEQFTLDNPVSYQLTFNQDMTVNIVADCNNAIGSYTADSSRISIQVGPMTMAACPEGSRSDDFVKYLGSTAIYFFKDGHLFIDLFADGGTMEFAPAGETSVIPGNSPADSQEALINILGNLGYTGVFPEKPIQLTDGYASYSEGGTGTPHVSLVNNMILTGDLNNDGEQDAVLLLEDDPEGTGRFTELVVVLNVWNDPKPVDAVIVGDRSGVKSLAVDGAQVIMDIVTQGPGDTDCCATWNVHLVYALENGQIVEKSRNGINQISLEDLNGTKWRLSNPGTDQRASQPEEMVTLQFKDGQISGFDGCNEYNASVSIGDYGFNSLKIGPITTTKKSCSEPATNQEKTYLNVLANTLSWTYEYGNLGLVYGTDNGQEDVLLLEPDK
jgi:heat shock protein HslJ